MAFYTDSGYRWWQVVRRVRGLSRARARSDGTRYLYTINRRRRRHHHHRQTRRKTINLVCNDRVPRSQRSTRTTVSACLWSGFRHE